MYIRKVLNTSSDTRKNTPKLEVYLAVARVKGSNYDLQSFLRILRSTAPSALRLKLFVGTRELRLH